MTYELKEAATVALFTYQLAYEGDLTYDDICRLNLEHGLCAFCSCNIWDNWMGWWDLERSVMAYTKKHPKTPYSLYMADTISDWKYKNIPEEREAYFKRCLQARINFLIKLLS